MLELGAANSRDEESREEDGRTERRQGYERALRGERWRTG